MCLLFLLHMFGSMDLDDLRMFGHFVCFPRDHTIIKSNQMPLLGICYKLQSIKKITQKKIVEVVIRLRLSQVSVQFQSASILT